MKRNYIYLIPLFLILFFLFPLNIYASLAPPTYGVNPETQECSEFTLGDECTLCIMPEGWERVDEFECPDGFTEISANPICTPIKSTFCCTAGHSGSQGDCEDLIINEVEQKCAFVADINRCKELPKNWEAAEEGEFLGKICPDDHTWLQNEIDCELEMIQEEEGEDRQNIEENDGITDIEGEKDSNTMLIYILTLVILIETFILIYLLLKPKKLKEKEEKI
jgi:hypothetical protein